MGGLLNPKIKIKIPNNWGITQKQLKKKPHQPFGEGGEGLNWN